MDQDATQLIQQRIAELPADVRDAIQSADLGPKVQAIGTKHQLHIDQIGELEDETMLAMLGFSPIETLGKRFAEVLHLSPDAAEQLASDINTQIFDSIRESMKRFAAAKAQTATPAAAPTAPAATNAPPTPAVPAKPPVSPEMHQADVVLSEKTVSTPKPIYKADPYREPV